MSQQTFLQQFAAARRASTPLICVRTADPALTITSIQKAQNGTAPPMLHWDVVRGLTAINDRGAQYAAESTEMPVEALKSVIGLPAGSILFLANFHRVVNEIGVSQALWNLRDKFKRDQRSAVALCPSIELPAELQQDVVILDEPLPTNDQLRSIVRDTYKSAELKLPAEDVELKATDALCGLAGFPAEQVCAMSITRNGLDMDALWERKRTMIEQTPGLTVWRGGETFDAVGGCGNVKKYLNALLTGRRRPRGVVWLDEIDKAVAGSGTDLSGVTTEMEGTLLTWMQDHEATGMILLGFAGTGKSMIAKATGNTGEVPTIQFDLGAMKGSLVGESNARLRQALKVVDAVTQGRALFLATCNSIGSISMPLRRRFSRSTFFFDLPTSDEQASIVDIYSKKYAPPTGKNTPDLTGWTGAEIRNLYETAWDLKLSLQEASQFIVPLARSAADDIRRLRQQASGHYVSASLPGVYQMKAEESAREEHGGGRRKLEAF